MANYEINVSKDGIHLFATHERSLTSPQQTRKVYDKLVETFPKNDGYLVEISYCQTTSRKIEPKELN